MLRILKLGLTAMALAALTGCTPDYSPNTYSGNAVQQANKVEPGIVAGYREVAISADGTVGAVEGGAAGGILGSQSGAIGLNAALGTVGGSVIGGLVGATLEHVTSDTKGWEYIVRKSNGDLLSVTQREPTPLPIGQKVLVITGNQARIIADYSVPVEPPAPAKASAEAKESVPAKEPADDKQAAGANAAAASASDDAGATPAPASSLANAPATSPPRPITPAAAASPPAPSSTSTAASEPEPAVTPAAATASPPASGTGDKSAP